MALQSKGRIVPKGIKRLCDLLNLFLNRYETGLLCFFSATEPLPDIEDIARILNSGGSSDTGVRIQNSNQTPYAQAVVERTEPIYGILAEYGGFGTFREVFAMYRREQPEKAKVLIQLSLVGGAKYGCIEDVADANDTYVRKIQRIRYKAIHQIAREIYSAHSLSKS